MIFAASGMLTVLVGALALYLASPQQKLARRPMPAAGWTGLACLILGLVLLWQWAGPATAIFIAMTLATLAWTIVPPVVAWLRRPKEPAR